jgi:TRAP transporter TAXI family solute receptor
MKKITLLILMMILAVALAACGSSTEPSTSDDSASNTDGTTETVKETSIVFGTGGTSGVYYPIGGALKPVFEQSELISNVTVEATGASVQNLQNIQDGLNQVVIVMSDVVYDAVNGQGQFEGNAVNGQALAGLYPNVVQLVATADSGITSVADLKGKRVSVGAVGSGVEQSAQKVLEAVGFDYSQLGHVDHASYADSVTAMQNGNLDAAFFTSGVPNSNVAGLQQTMDITIVPIDGEVAENLLASYPFYESYQIPAGEAAKYNLSTAVDTVAIKNMFVVSSDLDADVVYEMTKRLYEYLGTDAVSVGALKEFNRDNMAKNLVAELHPGAKRFYEEVGLVD